MSEFSYPFVCECSNCGAEVTITRAEAKTVSLNPDSSGALEIALRQRGWLRDEGEGPLWCPVWCPDCATTASST
jgi:hypothetical protein